MKKFIINLILLFFLLYANIANSQEWKNIKQYKKNTGKAKLCEGCWLLKDRKNNTAIWGVANQYNLKTIDGDTKYVSISQKRDFYLWYDKEIKRKKHEIKWIGIAYIAASQFSKVDANFIRFFIVRNNEIVQFLEKGSDEVFNFAFPHLKDVYYSKYIIKGKDAKKWDLKFGMQEQCEILDPLYNKLSLKAVKKLERMAKGKGVFSLGIPKTLKFDGELMDCKLRYDHGINKLLPYYMKQVNKY